MSADHFQGKNKHSWVQGEGTGGLGRGGVKGAKSLREVEKDKARRQDL